MNIGIRKFKESDAIEFQKAILESVPHVSKWLPWCSDSYSIDEAKLFTSSSRECWVNGTDYRFVIEDLDSLSILGAVGINQVVPQHKVGNLGYWVRASVLNKGVCTQAAKLTIEFAFRELGFRRIEIHVLLDNEPSNAVASKLGGINEGILRNKLMHSGVSTAANTYSVIPSDYGIN